MLRLSAGQVESLWDEVLPGEVRKLPEDLEALDGGFQSGPTSQTLDQEQNQLPGTAAIDHDAAVLVPALTRLSGARS